MPEADRTEELAAALRRLLDAGDLETLRGGIAELSARCPGAAEPFASEELRRAVRAHTLERARLLVRRLLRALTVVRSRPENDLNLNRWREYDDLRTDSLWLIPRRENSGAHNAGYWGNYVPDIPNQMIRRFTRAGEVVLDPFAGMGTTLIEARRLGRHALGVDLQPEVVRRAQAALAEEPDPHGVTAALRCADSRECDFRTLLADLGHRSVQLALLHPPYHDIIRFSEDPRDLSNAPSLEQFLTGLEQVLDRVLEVLDPGRHLVLVIGDKYARGEWVPLGFQAMERFRCRGLVLRSTIVKNFEETAGKRRQKELWRYRALAAGFYVFKHEYLFLFQRPTARTGTKRKPFLQTKEEG